MRRFLVLCISLFTFFLPLSAQAESGCLLIVSYPEGKTLRETGRCDKRAAPASTFKIPLAVMGFDSRQLKDAHHPSLAYRDDYRSDMDIQKKTTDPTIWLAESIVWYSQRLTRRIGREEFADYVSRFSYGNSDVSGMPPLLDGLTHSWLFTSLKISPREQVAFLTRLLNHDLDVSDAAMDSTIAIMPVFSAGGWTVYGKTGSGWERDPTGAYNKKRPRGWFVGWAEKQDRKIVFAKFISGSTAWKEYGGPKARDEFLSLLADGRID